MLLLYNRHYSYYNYSITVITVVLEVFLHGYCRPTNLQDRNPADTGNDTPHGMTSHSGTVGYRASYHQSGYIPPIGRPYLRNLKYEKRQVDTLNA